ncbi:MAG: hypothetical protein LBD93_09000 [Treponema sp.]|jgi:hypothetical protein|nr:hypothetical protein [Treponema sp.]
MQKILRGCAVLTAVLMVGATMGFAGCLSLGTEAGSTQSNEGGGLKSPAVT